MAYLGDFRLGDTLDGKFCTVATTGAPTTLAGSPVISAYVGNNTTQLTAGITLSVDFDGVTGMHNIRVVATSGNGYATASNYDLVVTTGTVSGTSIAGYVVHQFSIENRSAIMPTTAARTLDVTATGGAGIDWSNVEAPTTSLALTGTTIATTQKVDLETIKTNPVVNAGTITFPTTATLASTTNITAGTITTVTTTTTATNLTNAPTAGDFTAVMKTSLGTAVAASAVASVTGNVGGNVTGSVGSVVGAVGSVTGAVGSVTGNVGGSVASVVGAVGSVTGLTASNLDATVSSRATPAQVATQVTNVVQTTIPDAVPADGTAPSMQSALYMLVQFLGERSVAGTTLTVNKPDGTTALMTFTLNDATTPTAITRTT